MGCWNATCNVSRLPIFCGDEIVVIPLIAVSATVTANTNYATDNFVPFSFPIVGKYNDYGGIEDAVITEENDKLIRSYEFYKSNGDGTAPYKVEIGDDMEKFISEEALRERHLFYQDQQHDNLSEWSCSCKRLLCPQKSVRYSGSRNGRKNPVQHERMSA